jgi:hypothetical protein
MRLFHAKIASCVFVLVETLAHAQSSSDGKAEFEAGMKLYRDHAVPEALAEFELSYRIGHRASALKNAAQCHRDLQQFATAFEEYQSLLAAHSTELSPAERDAVTQALVELKLLTGTLTVTVNDPGATIAIDGASIGTSPQAAPKRVSLSIHKVEVTHEGREPFAKDVTVGSNEDVVVEAKLESEDTMGHITAREQAGRSMHVWVDEKDVGAAPWEGLVAPGAHTIQGRSGMTQTAPVPFTIARRERRSFVLETRSIVGHVRWVTKPANAQIEVDGVPRGQGAWEGDVTPGRHTVRVTANHFVSVERSLVVVEGARLNEDVTLEQQPPLWHGFYALGYVFGRPGFGAGYALPSGVAGSVSANVPWDLGVKFCAGYAFGPIAIEAVASGWLGPLRTEHVFDDTGASILRLGGAGVGAFLAGAVRATSKPGAVRLSGALSLGGGAQFFGLTGPRLDCGNNPYDVHGAGGLCATFPSTAASTELDTAYSFVGIGADLSVVIRTPSLYSLGIKLVMLGVDALLQFPTGATYGPEEDTRVPSKYLVTVDGDPRYYPMFATPQLFVGPSLGSVF